MSLRSYYESLLNNPNIRRALNLISKAEGADYYTLVGEGTNNKGLLRYGTSKHPKDLGYKGVYNPRVNDYSTAAGRYQIVGKTWRGLQKAGIVGNSFEPREQDIAAIALIAQRGALNDVLSGNVASFVSKARDEWESFKLTATSKVLSYWNYEAGGSAGATAGSFPTPNVTPAPYFAAVFQLSDSQKQIARSPLPAKWRGLIVLTVAAVVFFVVASNSGMLK